MTLRSLSVGAGLPVAAALCSVAADAPDFLPAFPGAAGFGARTTSDRAARVLAVTELGEDLRHRLDSRHPADGELGADGDGYAKLEEFLNATDPTVAVDYTVRG